VAPLLNEKQSFLTY